MASCRQSSLRRYPRRRSDEASKSQAAAWNAAIEAAAYDCEQAARGHRLRAASDDPRDPFNLTADQLGRHTARIGLIKTETSRGRRFFEQAEETLWQ